MGLMKKKVRILGLDWPVIQEKDIDNDESFLGRIYYIENIIKVKKGMPSGMQDIALIHEVLHAISAHGDIQLEENQVKLVANGLWQFLKDNYGKELGI
jgi:hypothetical protein